MRVAALKLISLAVPETSDADLLVRFVAKREESAFEELLRRHGPAVLRVCRRLVGPDQAEDAFQAVFLVLACRARGVRKAASVGSWLIGVAGRVALQMRQQTKQRQHMSLGDRDDVADPSQAIPDSQFEIPELAAALDEELTRLPDALRAPVVMCLVEGRTQEEAVAELGSSLRTLRRRLDRAKALLRLRLEKRGIVPVIVAALIGNMQTLSAVPPDLIRRTVCGVFEFLAGGTGTHSAPAAIAQGVITKMATYKAGLLLSITALVMAGLGVVLAQDRGGNVPTDPVQQKPGDSGQGKDPLNQPQKDNNQAKEPEIGLPPTPREGQSLHRSKNFLVYAPIPTMARAIAAEAEYQRAELAKLWLGKELPEAHDPCQISYGERLTSSRGQTILSFGKQKDGFPVLLSSHIILNDEFLHALTNELSPQVMRVVMSTHFGTLIPPWADDGLSIATRPVEDQAADDRLCRKFLTDGRAIRLRVLFPMTRAKMNDHPKEVCAAEGHSIVRFLMQQKVNVSSAEVGLPQLRIDKDNGNLDLNPKLQVPVVPRRILPKNGQQQFILFLQLGMENNTAEHWDIVAKSVYGFEGLDGLEEAWLNYLRQPQSVIDPSGKKPVVVAPKDRNSNLIPPTPLPGGKP